MSEQGTVYLSFILSEVQAEYDRRASVQARAQSIGGFSTTAFALAAGGVTLALGKDHALSGWSSCLAMLALGLFLASTAAALTVFSIGRPYGVADKNAIDSMLGAHWTDTEVDARNAVGKAASETLLGLRRGNNLSVARLALAGYIQVAALFALMVAVALEYLLN